MLGASASGRTWAACGGSRGHLFSPRISLGRPWLGSWLGTQLCTECWGPGGGQALTGFGLDYPVSGSKSKRAAPGRLWLLEAVLRRAALQTHLHSEGKRRQLQLNGQDLLQRGRFQVFPGLRLPQGRTLEKAGLGTTFSRASCRPFLRKSALLCLFSHATICAGVCDTGSSWRRGCLAF